MELLLGDLQLLHAGAGDPVLFSSVLLTLLLFGQLVLLLIELRQALGDLPIKLHEGRGGLGTKCLQGIGWQQAAECAEFFIQALTIIGSVHAVDCPGAAAALWCAVSAWRSCWVRRARHPVAKVSRAVCRCSSWVMLWFNWLFCWLSQAPRLSASWFEQLWWPTDALEGLVLELVAGSPVDPAVAAVRFAGRSVHPLPRPQFGQLFLSWSTAFCAVACSLSSWRPKLCSKASG